ncbi:MAG TPA: phosphatidylglycerophosphatase A [Candidatus Limnocylindrales bacterium]|nr:phosphatidylglycerophosphatase A [Candidatus Limnocylindrales bacterium]
MITKPATKFYKIYHMIGTGFYVGYTPVAPGTVASVATLPLYFILRPFPWTLYLGITLLLFLVGVKAANEIQKVLGQPDPGIVVIDEIVGYLLTLFLLPKTIGFVVGGFFLFRLFDIFKPFGIRKIDQNPNLAGFGTMADDAIAGIYSNLVLQVVHLLLK